MGLPSIPYNKKIAQISQSHLGYVLAIASAALFGLIHSVSKPLLSSSSTAVEINPITLAAIIYIINGLFFTPIKKNVNSTYKITRKNFFIIIMIGVAEVIALIMYFFGLKESTAVNASILANSEIIFTILVAMTVFREKLKKRELWPFALMIAGIVFVPLGYELYHNGLVFTDLVVGNLLIIFSGVFYAIDVNLSKYVSNKIDPKRIVQLASLAAGGLAFSLILILQIPFEIDFRQIPSIVVIGLFGTGIATFFFIISLRFIGAIRTILLFSTTTVFGMVFAAIFLQETVTLSHVFSIILVSSGTYLLRNRLGKSEIIFIP